MSEINLSGADLTKAILAGADLTNANLTTTRLTQFFFKSRYYHFPIKHLSTFDLIKPNSYFFTGFFFPILITLFPFLQ
ncbi:MAG: pentapeptide repeat-containing protein, partial [Nostoc sp.]